MNASLRGRCFQSQRKTHAILYVQQGNGPTNNIFAVNGHIELLKKYKFVK
jgi:hypothetical protein